MAPYAKLSFILLENSSDRLAASPNSDLSFKTLATAASDRKAGSISSKFN